MFIKLPAAEVVAIPGIWILHHAIATTAKIIMKGVGETYGVVA